MEYDIDTSARGFASAMNWFSQGREKGCELLAAESAEAAQAKAARTAKGKAGKDILIP